MSCAAALDDEADRQLRVRNIFISIHAFPINCFTQFDTALFVSDSKGLTQEIKRDFSFPLNLEVLLRYSSMVTITHC